MTLAVCVRKTMALTLATLLVGPGVELVTAQEAQSETREERQERRRRHEEKQQEREQARQQEQEQRRQEREEHARRREQRDQEERDQRQREREERAQRQQERQIDQRRQQQEERRNAGEGQRQEQERAERRQERERQRAEDGRRQQERLVEEQRRQERERQVEQERLQRQQQAEQDQQRREAERRRGRSERSERIYEQDRGAQVRHPRPSSDGRRYEGDGRRDDRWSDGRRDQVIRENRERSSRYYERWDQREHRGRERALQLQHQRRLAHYRYQQRYLERIRDQWRRDHYDARYYDYDRDPYFWSAPEYRYHYGGRWYETSRYGADFLEEAVNRGYEEGFLAGQADREDRWDRGYRDSYVYEDASYGYRGFYVDEDQYRHYFRQGFERGYQDGYHGRHVYGHHSDGKYKVLAAVLAGILVFEALR